MRTPLYTLRTAVISSTEMLIGRAAIGSSESDPVWRIVKLTDDGAGNLATAIANGKSNFDCRWSDRLTYSYI